MIKVLYTIFIGLLLVTFIGVGVAAFYPAPEHPEYPDSSPREVMTEPQQESSEEREELAAYEQAYSEYEDKREHYARNVSLILVGFALLVLVLCLSVFKTLPVIADGLLLGGVFTLIYGIGWSFAAGDKRFMFVVVTVGLAVAIGLGYWKFIRPTATKKK